MNARAFAVGPVREAQQPALGEQPFEQRRVQREGLVDQRLRLRGSLSAVHRQAVGVLGQPRRGDPGIGPRVLRVGVDRVLEVVARLAQPVDVALGLEGVEAEKVELVRVERIDLGLRALLQPERLERARRDQVRQFRETVRRLGEDPAPDRLSAPDREQPDGDAKALARAEQLAGQHVVGVELLLEQSQAAPFVVHPPERERGIAREDQHALGAFEAVDDVVGQAVRRRLLDRTFGLVRERQHREPHDPVDRRGAAQLEPRDAADGDGARAEARPEQPAAPCGLRCHVGREVDRRGFPRDRGRRDRRRRGRDRHLVVPGRRRPLVCRHGGDQTVTLARDGGDVFGRRRAVPERLSQLRHALVDRTLRDYDARPDRVEQLVGCHDVACARGERHEQLHLARLQLDDLAVARDLVDRRVDQPLSQPEPIGRHEASEVRKWLIPKDSEKQEESISEPSGLRGERHG